ncbi:MAG: LLM class flavin-dependent oxidoreductase [SAR202 cluster bacterium]|nr:LLM class flavin-dependent oxidoreductase [SAR202 cluster bacterium]
MKFDLFCLPTIPGTLEDRARLRPIGRNNDRYQQMLDELRKIVVFADKAGFHAFSTTEHHFHSEGYEASVAPLLLYADFAARTKNIKFAPLGLVLPSWDPIRCAEELAILDHLTKGRVIAGFARGYQDRWTNVLGQQYHVTAATMDGSAIDERNREVFEEVFEIIKLAWTQDTLSYKGKYYSVPVPYEEGIRRWPPTQWTASYGAPGEMDSEGVIRKISVIPKPYQNPHPPFWQPFAVSETTIRRCAQRDIVPWIMTSLPPNFTQLCQVYQEVAAKEGREHRLGQNVGAIRAVYFGKTYEDAFKLGLKAHGIGFHHYFGGFGFVEPFRNPGEESPRPLTFPTERQTFQRMVDHDFAICGTVDQVKRKIESLSKCHSNGSLEWFGWSFGQGFLTWPEAQDQLALFEKHIMPEFKG